jgi:hypothetical protein
LLEPLPDIGGTIFEDDAVRLAADEKFDGVSVDESYILQIKYQLLLRGLPGSELLQLRDIFCGNSSTKSEDNSTIS